MSNWYYAYMGVGGGDQTEIRRRQFEDIQRQFVECRALFDELDTTDKSLEQMSMIVLHEHVANLNDYLKCIRNGQIKSLKP